MHIRDIRLARLAVLLAEHNDNKAALARTLGKQPAQVSQWFNGVRTITEESARAIERSAKKPARWLDEPIYATAPPSTRLESGDAMVLTVEERELVLRIRAITGKDTP